MGGELLSGASTQRLPHFISTLAKLLSQRRTELAVRRAIPDAIALQPQLDVAPGQLLEQDVNRR
jgi:hypothetical protein